MDQEALFLLPRLDFSRHPLWHRTAPCPALRLIFRIPVLRGYLSAFQLAAAPFGTPYRPLSRTYPTTIAKGGKLLFPALLLRIFPISSRIFIRASTDIEARLFLAIRVSLQLKGAAYSAQTRCASPLE